MKKGEKLREKKLKSRKKQPVNSNIDVVFLKQIEVLNIFFLSLFVCLYWKNENQVFLQKSVMTTSLQINSLILEGLLTSFA